MSSHSGGPSGGVHFETDEHVDEKLDEPRMYRVFIHNDHYTSMDFVVEVLVKVFRMPVARATQVMLDVHRKGIGECGVYTFDVAQTKVNQVHSMARARQYPLKSSYEEA
jgi:ATP-dependent Clp protease adaptor protein ClpS